MDAGPRTAPPMSPSGGLARLLEAEARLDDQVAESLREAEAVVAAAHAAVAGRLAAVEQELSAIGQEEVASLDAASEARRAAIEARAAACEAHYSGAATGQRDALVALAVSAVLRDASEGGGA
jgi:vacuolar-type H+-ATPase subunit H